MPLSKEVRLLESKWKSGQGWPKRLEWLEIDNIRGWAGERIDFQFPIVALVGENGVGKSTILQAVAASYRSDSKDQYFASDFFPDTPWEQVESAAIRASVREGPTSSSVITSVRKPSERWRGNDERKDRKVEYIDLRRIQPISARTGYARMAKKEVRETSTDVFDRVTLDRLSNIMGRLYDSAKLSTTDADETRKVPVLSKNGRNFSGFHGGAGETATSELIKQNIHKYSMLIIDEVETSLHPRAQRRLLRDIASICRNLEVQCVLSTHSPYILDELPPEGRIYIVDSDNGKKIFSGVSPEFAMTKMDDERYPEADVYVEDDRAVVLINEIVSHSDRKEWLLRFQAIPYGAANVGRALGSMVNSNRFPRPSVVFLDGDQEASQGCSVLPGADAPERVVFDCLCTTGLTGLASRISRSPSDVADACNAAMLTADHHEWVRFSADRLSVAGNVLWQSMCAEWCLLCLGIIEANRITDIIVSAIVGRGGAVPVEVVRPQGRLF
jgi:predicted ATPase